MDAVTIGLRFLFGAVVGGILVAFLAIWGLVPLWLGVAMPLISGLLAVFFGDRFLVGFMRVFRWLQ
ncbi:MAG: hypothetical protein Q8L65_09585 [Burkholderiales bacterium]|nr:hypothetical protein [Burkholderiales bacterium]MDP2397712.1 hypothetical protein [Burkholderiales bacterium]MDP3715234.1 hypothetical protein [Burkholderiales bacterium]